MIPVLPVHLPGAFAVQDDAAKFEEMEYCKTDLVPAKGIVFIKFARASSAMKALEDIQSHGLVRFMAVFCC